jgi:uncharacterized RDD family membrane protein YckC
MFCTRCGSVNADGARFCKGCGSPLDPSGAGAVTAAAASAPIFAQPAPQFRYAGFWRRFVAWIIDSLVFSPLFLIFLATTGMFGVIGGTNRDLEGMATAMFGLGILALSLVAFAASWLYYTLMESSRRQATLGKMALGIIVTDLNGNRISFARANGRFFGKWVSGMIMNIGYLMAAFTEKKQALHDMLASCLVILK